MKKIFKSTVAAIIMLTFLMTGCGHKEEVPAVADGSYVCTFNTDSTMFKINEALDGKALLTVSGGEMTVHISLPSKKTLNLYPGLKEDAQADGAKLLMPTVDTVEYSDGTREEVHGFDVPVPAIDEEFDLALIGTKGKWYDHKVSVSDLTEGDSVPGLVGISSEEASASETADEASEADGSESVEASDDETAPAETGSEENAADDAGAATSELADGTYTVEAVLEGGSGKASITSPTELTIEGGKVSLKLEFSSANYDYMLAGDKRYEADTTGGLSVFNLEAEELQDEYDIIADTTAMSKPHEIEYKVKLDLASLSPAD
ncbi:hypothetical protein [Butyrivibrio sp. MC2013]|uniref:hypothetical protein n=1 Tax=Butyrivibrio sp. MC2013 TaxID=1280686 RepID=UPI0003F6F487|nr:hypothetical protein [Butyrivibrio sp. MC2013]